MFLKTLVIRGFKSFADRATFDFEPGITVVVGPNGSGKSNVVDAIAWVLGAQAPTAVRSQRMDDVIFAGTSARAALGRAEVSLTIDNGSGHLPMAFNEVTITRTLFRSGDSEYAINGVPCRLLDVQELLSDAGVGRQQHVVASQGHLDAILNARPEDRRAVVEEAAGVLKHRRRRERSERRLAATEANLTRVNDLLREVRRQLRPLEKQAAAAARAEEIGDEVHRLRRYLGGREIAALEARHAAIVARRGGLAGRTAEVEGELVQLDGEVGRLEDELRRAGTGRLSELVARAETVRERARGQAALLAERGRALERELAQADDRSALAVLDGELERARGEEQAILADLARLDGERIELERAEHELGIERDAAQAARDDAAQAARDDAAQAARDDAAQAARDDAAQAARDDAAQAARDDAEQAAGDHAGDDVGGGSERSTTAPPGERLDELRTALSGLDLVIGHRSAELRRLAQRAEHLGERVRRLAAERARLGEETASAADADEQLARAVTDADDEHRAAEARLGSAETARREAEAAAGGWEARAEALGEALEQVRARAGAERLAGSAGVLGTLLDVVEIEEGWEAAVEAAIGDALAAVVVDGRGHARAALDALHRGGHRGAVLAAEATGGVSGATGASAAGPVGEVVGEAIGGHVRPRSSLPSPQRVALQELLDRLLRGAVRASGSWEAVLDAAIAHGPAHPDLVVVSNDGDRFASSGWQLGAARARATDALHQEARRRAAEALEARTAATADHERCRAEAARAQRLHQQAARAADEHAARRRSAAQAAERSARELDDARSELATVEAEVLDLRRQLAVDEQRRQTMAGELPELEAAAADAAARAAAAARRRAELDRTTSELARRRGLLETRDGLLRQRSADVAARQVALRGALEGAVAALGDQEQQKIELVARSAVVGRLAEVVVGSLAAVDGLLGDLRRRRDELASETRARGRRVDDARRRRTELERQLTELTERSHRAELEATEAMMRLEAARDALRRDLDVEPEAVVDGLPGNGAARDGASAVGDAPLDAPPLPEGMDPSLRLRDLERELRQLGPINPLARQEHDALLERHSFLEEQLTDVRTSRRDLARVIRAIDDEISAAFTAAFSDVARHFSELFETLFPGGRGELRLTDPDDLLATGIEIEARPSGKNVRKLSLLSGGERALTALGLLFAIFRSRPSPFYVLDEVEAALDDVNLQRFLDLLEQFRPEAQLIIVSHQKRTMEIADCLYGVTMRPGESSTVLSERLREVG